MAKFLRVFAIGLGALSAALVMQVTTPNASGDLRVSMTPIVWNGFGYSPFEAQNYSQEKYFDVNSSGYVGDYFITFSSGMNGSGSFRYAKHGNDGIQYQLYLNNNREFSLRAIPNINRVEEVVSGSFSSGGTQVRQDSVYVWVPPYQHLAPGTYTDQFDVKVYPGTFHNNVATTPLYTTTVTIEIVVDEIMEIAIGNGDFAETGNINFGVEELQEGQKLRYDIRVRSNRDYHLLFNSQNLGYLVHEEPAARTKIQYFLKMDNRDIAIHTPITPRISRPPGTFGQMEITHQAEFRIGKTKHAFKGNYSDSFHFSLEPL